HARLTLHGSRGAALPGLFAAPRSVRSLAAELPGATRQAAADCVQLLAGAGALTPATPDGGTAEDANPTLAQWSFADLLFHTRSRFGRHADRFGANFRHAGKIPPQPALRPLPRGEPNALPRPDLERALREDPPFAQVQEARRSVYDYGERPITVAQLAEFLYRVARVRRLDAMDVHAVDGSGHARMEVTSRPYPAGGKCYEIELYPLIDRCEGLDAGLYFYDPLEHRLVRIRPRDAHCEALLAYARVAAPRGRPQILIVLSARFQRVSWKYDAIAYAATLKHVGVLYQTMYLAATAMGLAPCALGSGDADLFAAAAGTDYLVEGSVGEFMLGSLPEAGS